MIQPGKGDMGDRAMRRKEGQLRVDGGLTWEALCYGFMSLVMPTREDAAIKTGTNKPVSTSTDFSRKGDPVSCTHGEAYIPLQICLDSRLHMTWLRNLIALFLSGIRFPLSCLIPVCHRGFELKCQWEKSISFPVFQSITPCSETSGPSVIMCLNQNQLW